MLPPLAAASCNSSTTCANDGSHSSSSGSWSGRARFSRNHARCPSAAAGSPRRAAPSAARKRSSGASSDSTRRSSKMSAASSGRPTSRRSLAVVVLNSTVSNPSRGPSSSAEAASTAATTRSSAARASLSLHWLRRRLARLCWGSRSPQGYPALRDTARPTQVSHWLSASSSSQRSVMYTSAMAHRAEHVVCSKPSSSASRAARASPSRAFLISARIFASRSPRTEMPSR
mmetsp:Transcript_22348/g.75244  ORF Transcript_22348/g.75244 Transcript_22348/m.75244 type:complete len:230 (-) Transcript_22348:317-1006(-)